MKIIASKKCDVCEKEFHRKSGTMSNQTWDGRRFCSVDCTYKGRNHRPRNLVPSKVCEACGNTFQKATYSTIAAWNNRRACCRECSSQLRRTLTPKICRSCGKEFQPQSWRAIFCCRRCAADSHKGPLPKKGMHEKYVRIYVNGERVLEHRRVMELMIGRALIKEEHVHHKNGNTKDNRPENLELWWRAHPSGQRADDIIEYVARFHATALIELMRRMT